jgi:hypothetical protein
MLPLLLLLGGIALQDDPPPYPVFPGRPPPLASGEAFGGVLGSACDDTLGEDGRWFNDHLLSLSPGQTQGIMVSSSEFAPWLQIVDGDGDVVAEAQGAADGEVVGLAFKAAGEPSREFLPPVRYRLRVTSVDPGGVGRWKVETNYSGRLEALTGPFEFPVRTGCRPLGPVLPE